MRVRVTKKCYFDNRIRREGSIIEIPDDLKLPSWAEPVDPVVPEKEAELPEKPKETTLNQMASKPAAKVNKPNTKKG